MMGRPTKWSVELEKKAWKYVNGAWESVGHAIPSVVGLCNILGVNRNTLYRWSKEDDKEFCDILEACNQNQELTLLNGSLKNQLNANISKLVLGKHGYSEKSDDNKDNAQSETIQKVQIEVVNVAGTSESNTTSG